MLSSFTTTLSFCVLGLSLSTVSARRLQNALASSKEDLRVDEPAECGAVVNDRDYFDGQRPEQCTKKDVCLLMRQLDAFFYARALSGEMVQYTSPPQRSWISKGRCARNIRSIKMKPVYDAEICERAAQSLGITGQITSVHDESLPSGCVRKNEELSVNTLETDVESGVTYTRTSDKPWAQSERVEIQQFCEVDHSLTEAAASYYSPYKLKQSMRERPEMSTTCSFGMMAHLHNLNLTSSPCAKILAFRPSLPFESAADALKAAETASGAEATAIKEEVAAIRQKFVLIEAITNHWCPDTWKAGMSTAGSTCQAPRFPSWASHGFGEDANGEAERAVYLLDGIGGETKADLAASRTPKIGLTEASCSAFTDITLDSVLQGASETPPDFFRDAMLGKEATAEEEHFSREEDADEEKDAAEEDVEMYSDANTGAECGRDPAIVSGNVPGHFGAIRQSQGISEQCTKRDVCLLMRQLDTYFYTRARRGTLVDYKEAHPQRSWLNEGRCGRNARSIKMRPIFNARACRAAARAEGVRGELTRTNSTEYPSGCFIRNNRVFINGEKTSVEASVEYVKTGDKPWSPTKRIEIRQFCEVDYSLEEASAFYYSPYKLKQSMQERPQASTTCSFGMMALLFNANLTDSPCARILAYRPSLKFDSAAEALKVAESAPAGQAAAIKEEVSAIRKKFVLIEAITNHWCPDTWTEAMGSQGSTCSAPRFPSWAKTGFHADGEGEAERAEYLLAGIGGETKADLAESRADKIALTDQACAAIGDVSLDSILDSTSETPPDFFRDANI